MKTFPAARAAVLVIAAGLGLLLPSACGRSAGPTQVATAGTYASDVPVVPAQADPTEIPLYPPAEGTVPTAAEIDSFLRATPTDAQLKSASDADLVRLAVRCLRIKEMTFCLHTGWADRQTPAEVVRRVQEGIPAAARVDPAGRGDMPVIVALRRWAAQPARERAAFEAQEVADALEGADKAAFIGRN